MIGVFDSGVGGLSVLKEIRALLPSADLIYLADQQNAPYGTRKLEEVRSISLDVANQLIDRGATTIVVACNTASAAALKEIRASFPDVPVVGMEPAVKPAAAMSSAKVVGVFATQATFQGELFDSVVARHANGARILTSACPRWVELVETGQLEGPAVEEAVAESARPVVDGGADVAVLGCTHFSFLYDTIRRVSGLALVDPAPAVARQVAKVAADHEGRSATTLLSSADDSALQAFASRYAEIDATAQAGL